MPEKGPPSRAQEPPGIAPRLQKERRPRRRPQRRGRRREDEPRVAVVVVRGAAPAARLLLARFRHPSLGKGHGRRPARRRRAAKAVAVAVVAAALADVQARPVPPRVPQRVEQVLEAIKRRMLPPHVRGLVGHGSPQSRDLIFQSSSIPFRSVAVYARPRRRLLARLEARGVGRRPRRGLARLSSKPIN